VLARFLHVPILLLHHSTQRLPRLLSDVTHTTSSGRVQHKPIEINISPIQSRERAVEVPDIKVDIRRSDPVTVPGYLTWSQDRTALRASATDGQNASLEQNR
jgi:hypothetical protein